MWFRWVRDVELCREVRLYLVRVDLWKLQTVPHLLARGATQHTGRCIHPHSPLLPPLPSPLRATTRNAQISRTKTQEGEEASSQLVLANMAFTKAALVYSMQINEVQLKKGHEVQDRGEGGGGGGGGGEGEGGRGGRGGE